MRKTEKFVVSKEARKSSGSTTVALNMETGDVLRVRPFEMVDKTLGGNKAGVT